MRYRRSFVPGGSFFFTVVTAQRRPVFTSPEMVDVLRCALRAVRQARPFKINAMVVLPEHLHCIWTLPAGDADYMIRWRLIKTWFTKHCDPVLRGRDVWQKRYWEHVLRDEHDYARHLDYIHYNPVKHGLAASVGDWPYSSFQRFVKAGVYPPDWGSEGMVFEVVGDE